MQDDVLRQRPDGKAAEAYQIEGRGTLRFDRSGRGRERWWWRCAERSVPAARADGAEGLAGRSSSGGDAAYAAHNAVLAQLA